MQFWLPGNSDEKMRSYFTTSIIQTKDTAALQPARITSTAKGFGRAVSRRKRGSVPIATIAGVSF
jgi:hypothetical protein